MYVERSVYVEGECVCCEEGSICCVEGSVYVEGECICRGGVYM